MAENRTPTYHPAQPSSGPFTPDALCPATRRLDGMPGQFLDPMPAASGEPGGITRHTGWGFPPRPQVRLISPAQWFVHNRPSRTASPQGAPGPPHLRRTTGVPTMGQRQASLQGPSLWKSGTSVPPPHSETVSPGTPSSCPAEGRGATQVARGPQQGQTSSAMKLCTVLVRSRQSRQFIRKVPF